jgi:hypothetical protein
MYIDRVIKIDTVIDIDIVNDFDTALVVPCGFGTFVSESFLD